MSRYLLLPGVIAIFLALPTPPLLAAPFCVQTQAIPPECYYFDPAQCRKRASELNGYCVANSQEMVIRSGGTGSYCVVMPSRDAECIYADYTSCENAAGAADGVCIEKSAVAVAEDPYLLDINRKY